MQDRQLLEQLPQLLELLDIGLSDGSGDSTRVSERCIGEDLAQHMLSRANPPYLSLNLGPTVLVYKPYCTCTLVRYVILHKMCCTCMQGVLHTHIHVALSCVAHGVLARSYTSF